MKKLLIALLVILFANSVFALAPLKTEHAYSIDESKLCLAENMYWEVRQRNAVGMIGVSLVVLNRVNDKRYPNTICDVVYHFKQPFLTLNLCQFSWYCDGKPDSHYKHEKKVWEFALILADSILDPYCLKKPKGCYSDFTGNATLYHSRGIPLPSSWNKNLIKQSYSDDYHHYYIENKRI